MAIFGGMQLMDDRKRKVTQKRQAARTQVRQFIDDVQFAGRRGRVQRLLHQLLAGGPLEHIRLDHMTRAAQLLDLGRCFGDDLYEREVRYLIDHEWAVTAEDILWRRTKRGLTLSKPQADELAAWLEAAKVA